MSLLNGPHLARVSRAQNSLQVADGYILKPDPELFEASQTVVRYLLEPDREYQVDFGNNSLAQPTGSVGGPGLVYQRRHRNVISRPRYFPGLEVFAVECPLRRAALIDTESIRLGRIREILQDTKAPEWPAIIHRLVTLASSLNGLTPRSIDSLAILPDCPDALCAMLLVSSHETRADVLALQAGLPFLWMALPQQSWSAAQGALIGKYGNVFAMLDPDSGPASHMMKALTKAKTVFEGHCEAVPWLQGCMPDPFRTDAPPLGGYVSAHITVCDQDGLQHPDVNAVFNDPNLVTKTSFGKYDAGHTPTLLAPLALAAVSDGRGLLDSKSMAALRNVIAQDPDYVSVGFVHAKRELETLS
jgi:hypothetical protein